MTPAASKYRAGRRAEYRSMRVLEAAGYMTLRMAGSKGPVDVVGVSSSDVVLVQVKQGKRKPVRADREILREMKRPQNCRVMLHYWKPYSSEPEVWEL